MTERMQIYRCNICGNIVAVLHTGQGTLVCCDEPMQLLKEGEVDAATEKHVPVIEKAGGTVTVRVGEVPHPMEQKHYIEWIELHADGRVFCQFLEPGDEPVAVFQTDASVLSAREYCNLHGLWKG